MKKTLSILMISLFFGFLQKQENSQLRFQIADRTVDIKTLSELQDTLNVVLVQLFDPHYKKDKEFKGFLLSDLFNFAYGDQTDREEYSEVIFRALDGYEAVCTIDKIFETGGYIVFEDTAYPDWEPVKRKEAHPAPFYVVWTQTHQTTDNAYPWPWQVASIKLVKFKDQYPEVYPDGVNERTSIFAGYRIFKDRCFRCHSMNQQGGKVGPDLNAPKSIISYRTEFMIKEMIKTPSKYRYTNMPDHRDLSSFDLNSLVEYFHHMNENKD